MFSCGIWIKRLACTIRSKLPAFYRQHQSIRVYPYHGELTSMRASWLRSISMYSACELILVLMEIVILLSRKTQLQCLSTKGILSGLDTSLRIACSLHLDIQIQHQTESIRLSTLLATTKLQENQSLTQSIAPRNRCFLPTQIPGTASERNTLITHSG